MSKKKLIELIKMSDNALERWLDNVQLKDAREIFKTALKDLEEL